MPRIVCFDGSALSVLVPFTGGGYLGVETGTRPWFVYYIAGERGRSWFWPR